MLSCMIDIGFLEGDWGDELVVCDILWGTISVALGDFPFCFVIIFPCIARGWAVVVCMAFYIGGIK